MFEWKSAKNHFRVLRMEVVVRRLWGQWFEFYLLAVVPFLLLAVEKFFLLLAYATEGVGNLFARRFSIDDCPTSLLVRMEKRQELFSRPADGAGGPEIVGTVV